MLSKKHDIPVHITNISAKRFDSAADSPIHSRLFRRDVEFCETVGGMTVSSFRTPHDSKMSVGYRIELDCGIKIGLATDIGYVSEEVRCGLCGCDAVILEANHDLDMLMTGPYPRELKQRVASRRGHLSNRECADFASELAASGTRAFLLAHLSEENNEPYLAFDEVSCAVCGLGATVAVAAPDSPVELVIKESEDETYDERKAYNAWNS